jgi:methionine-rich copper-binding protein CopC
MSKLTRLFAGLALGATLFAGLAQAHAVLETMKVEGHDVILRFNGRIDATRSRLSIVNADGSIAQKIDSEAGEDPATLKGHLADLKPGSYTLRWEVLSVDGHISRADQTLVLPTP